MTETGRGRDSTGDGSGDPETRDLHTGGAAASQTATGVDGPPPGESGGGPADTGILSRYGLVRSREDRQVAGVCAAIARVTGTDPVLWRVLMAVGVLFGGVGLLGYLLGWLLMPEEGDTGSPLEALFGHGRSSTSQTVTVLLSTAAVVLLAITVQWTPVAAVVIAGAGYLVYRQRRPATPRPAVVPQPAAGQSPVAPPPGQPPATGPAAAEDSDDTTELLRLAERYRAGSYPSSSEPPVAGPSPEPPVAGPKRRSALGGMALSAMLLALGVVALVDLAGADLRTSAYLAAALTVTGGALLAGAWLGRARRLIWIGIGLAVALAVSTGLESLDLRGTGAQGWQPGSVAQVDPRYHVELGYGNLNLRNVDFTGRDVTVRLTVNTGSLEVFLPPDVDLTADLRVSYGNVRLFDQEISGASVRREVSDLGEDQRAGPGRVTLRITVKNGNVEVYR
jgi:phage shock protein PspC (stress-responsive transcriptional regulator)